MFKNRKRLIALAVLVTAVIAVAMTIVLRPRAVWPQELRIATATPGGWADTRQRGRTSDTASD